MNSRREVKALRDAGSKRTGYNNPDADTYIESWFRMLKEETVWIQKYSSFLNAKIDIERSSSSTKSNSSIWDTCLRRSSASFVPHMRLNCQN